MKEVTGSKKRAKWRRNNVEVFIMALCGVLFLAVFSYAPMFGLTLAFKNADNTLDVFWAMFHSEWADMGGFYHFYRFITDPDFKDVILNTLGFNLLNLAITMPIPVLLAVMFSEMKNQKLSKGIQFFMFLPHFISIVVFVGIVYSLVDDDCAVVCVGNTWLTEKEETDRFSLKLNPAAEDLILDVAQVNPNVIVVIYAGSAVDVSAFEGKVKAILYMGYCGEGANEAAADLISGRVSPCGKLAETFPKCLEDTATAERRGNGYTERYPEGVLVGYKYYEYNGIAPAYPFGYGLSYTTFRYGDMQVKKLGETDYYISFSVQNVGRHAAAEIVQVYLSDDASMVTRPRKELVAFGKKRLEVGETCTFGFNLTERDFAYFSPVLNEFYVENGTFTISVGASSADIRLQEKVEIELPDEKQFSRY